MSRVLGLVVVPYRRTPLEWLGYYQPSFFADTFRVLNELDFQSFVNDCVALEVYVRILHPLFGLQQSLILLEGIFHHPHCDWQTPGSNELY